MMQNYFVLTAAERTTAMGFNTAEFQVDPRAIDGATPGIGLNLNPDAASYAPGAPVTLVGNYIAPKRIVDDSDYQANLPDLITYLLTLPWATLEDETIFAPS
jgi:hypothetical protein